MTLSDTEGRSALLRIMMCAAQEGRARKGERFHRLVGELMSPQSPADLACLIAHREPELELGPVVEHALSAWALGSYAGERVRMLTETEAVDLVWGYREERGEPHEPPRLVPPSGLAGAAMTGGVAIGTFIDDTFWLD